MYSFLMPNRVRILLLKCSDYCIFLTHILILNTGFVIIETHKKDQIISKDNLAKNKLKISFQE